MQLATNSPSTPLGQRIYAIGDLHGRLDLAKRLVSQIILDVGDFPRSKVTIVFLGDYIDRGPDSAGCIQFLMDGPPPELQGCQWICLKGNHEDILQRFLTDTSIGERWVRNGALDTIRSYGALAQELDPANITALQATLERVLPEDHLRWIARLPTCHQAGDYIFVHAGLRPGTKFEDQDPRDMMWIREEFTFAPAPFPEGMVVHGHTIVERPELRPHRIGIDTGAYRSGVLTAIVLEDRDQRFIST